MKTKEISLKPGLDYKLTQYSHGAGCGCKNSSESPG